MRKNGIIKPPSPKLPGLATENSVISGLTAGLIGNLTSGLMSELKSYTRVSLKKKQTQEKKPIGAGRGGKYYSENKSHYSRF